MINHNPAEDLLLNQVWHNVKEGLLTDAESLASKLTRTYPDFSSGWYAASFIASKLGNSANANLFIDKALARSPNNARFTLQKSLVLDSLGKTADAVAMAHSAVEQAPNDPDLLSEVGSFLSYCELHNDAATVLRRAVSLSPNDSRFLYNLAAVLRFNGSLEETEALYDKAISLAPHDYEAYYNRTELRQQTRENNHIDELEHHLAKNAKSWQDQMLLRYALAKEYEDIGLFDNSISHLRNGSRIRRSNMAYELESDLETIDRIIKTFDSELLHSAANGFTSKEPIFIIGLPRTGTTLIERMLSNHTDVLSVGESNNFATAMIKESRRISVNQVLTRDELVKCSATVDFAALGRSYVKSTRPRSGEFSHFVDKLPLNFLYTGLIHLALPNAKIVHVIRHPMDTCYAIYKKLFRGAYPFSYDLEELGQYFLAYTKLLEHWHQMLPGRIFKIAYEDLILEPRRQLGDLLEYCELNWQENCINFQNNPQPTTTASASQVRQPIYTSSIGKWTNYRQALEPLETLLENAGIEIPT